MPTLARFLAVVGLLGGLVAGGLFVLSEYFEPVPKETAVSVSGVKVRK
jgi:hypothetical protein